jgi:hypothetical protein
MVFISVIGDGGAALQAAPTPDLAAQREADLRSLIREVTDHVGTPLLDAAGRLLTQNDMRSVISGVLDAAQAEIATW